MELSPGRIFPFSGFTTLCCRLGGNQLNHFSYIFNPINFISFENKALQALFATRCQFQIFFINSSQTRGSSSFVKSRNSGLKFDPNYILPGRGRETPQKWQSQLKPRFFLKWRENLTPTAMHLGVFVKFSQTHKKKRAPHKRMRFCSFFSVPRKIPARFLPFCGSQFRSIWMCIIKNPFAPESSQRQRVTVCYGRMWVASVCVRVMLGGYTVCNSLFKKKVEQPKRFRTVLVMRLAHVQTLEDFLFACFLHLRWVCKWQCWNLFFWKKINIVKTFVEMPF